MNLEFFVETADDLIMGPVSTLEAEVSRRGVILLKPELRDLGLGVISCTENDGGAEGDIKL